MGSKYDALLGQLRTTDSSNPSIGGAVTSGTSGSVLYINSSGQLAQDNADLFWDATNHWLGIGTTTPSGLLSVVGQVFFGPSGIPATGTALNVNATDLTSNVIINSFQAVGAAPASANVQALNFNVTDTSSNSVASLTGINGLATKNSSGTVTLLLGIQSAVRISGTTVATTIDGFNSQLRVQPGSSAATAVNYNVAAPTVTGTITSLYGIKIVAMKSANVTTGYGVASDGASDINYFMGKVGIGTATPQTTLDINGGMRTATSAQSANYQVLVTDSTIYATTGTTGITVTLPAASANTIGMYFFIYKVDAGLGALTIAGSGTDTLNGAATKTIANQWNGVLVRGLTATSYIVTSFTGL